MEKERAETHFSVIQRIQGHVSSLHSTVTGTRVPKPVKPVRDGEYRSLTGQKNIPIRYEKVKVKDPRPVRLY